TAEEHVVGRVQATRRRGGIVVVDHGNVGRMKLEQVLRVGATARDVARAHDRPGAAGRTRRRTRVAILFDVVDHVFLAGEAGIDRVRAGRGRPCRRVGAVRVVRAEIVAELMRYDEAGERRTEERVRAGANLVDAVAAG